MPDLLTLTAAGVIAGSIYLLCKALDHNSNIINYHHNELTLINDQIKNRRESAVILKQKLQAVHNAAFNAWLEIKKITDNMQRTLNKINQRLANKTLSPQERKNFTASRKTIINELQKARAIKQNAHNKWQKMLNKYHAAKHALEIIPKRNARLY